MASNGKVIKLSDEKPLRAIVEPRECADLGKRLLQVYRVFGIMDVIEEITTNAACTGHANGALTHDADYSSGRDG